MTPDSIVKYLQILKKDPTSFFSRLKTLPKDMSLFQSCKKRFRHCVVVTVPRAAHALDDAMLRQESSYTSISILLSAIRMDDQTRRHRTSTQSHLQRFPNSRRAKMIRHSMPNHAPCAHIFNRRQT